jgi:hypothetical protein
MWEKLKILNWKVRLKRKIKFTKKKSIIEKDKKTKKSN